MNLLTPREDPAQRPDPVALVALTDSWLGSLSFIDEAERADRRRFAEIGAAIAAELRDEESP
jgi:hypothetical protein